MKEDECRYVKITRNVSNFIKNMREVSVYLKTIGNVNLIVLIRTVYFKTRRCDVIWYNIKASKGNLLLLSLG